MAENIRNFILTGAHYIRTATLWDMLEVLLVAYVIYRVWRFVRHTSVERVIKGILILLIMSQVAQELQLNVISFVLSNTLQIGLIAILIMFQPELRKVLEQVGATSLRQIFEREEDEKAETKLMIPEIVEACSSMSWSRTGALIVFERKNALHDVVTASTSVDAKVTAELVKNIFFKNAPLHDGAMVISDGRIVAAGGVLPLSENEKLSKELGTRHRAGIGVTEKTDAISLMVSEETGAISVAKNGSIRRGLSPEALTNILTEELVSKAVKEEESSTKKKAMSILRGKHK
ncbi:MAG: TIGR00159 family protein [Ruminococcaceae bacterium]|nr:TIGR00159 family protein [Oscillospiraceae bacterium]